MSPSEILAELHRRGVLLVPAPDGRIHYRPKDALSPEERDDLARHRDAIRALLECDPVGWRTAVMAAQVPTTGAILFLLARPGARVPPGYCLSCGDALGVDDRYSCAPCVAAAVAVVNRAGS